MRIRIQADQMAAIDGAVRKIERTLRLFADKLRDSFRLFAFRKVAEFRQGERCGRIVLNDLDGPALVQGEHGTEDFVTPLERHQAASERLDIELTAQSQRHGEVEERVARLKLVHKPEPLLREGEGQCLIALGPADRWIHYSFTIRSAGRQLLAQRSDGGALKEGAQGQLHMEYLAYPRHELRSQQRVSAQLEEAVMHSH